MSPDIRIRLFGPFEARSADDRSLGLVGKKIQALLAYLAIEGPRPVSRETLASLLWSETGDDRARHNLRQALSKIRSICGDLVISEGDTLRLDDARCEVDACRLAEQLESDDVDDIAAGLALYRGELLEGSRVREEPFEDWLRAAKTRVRDSVFDGYERLTDGLLEAGRADEAIGHLRDRLALDPTSEPTHRALMRILADGGRRSEALRQYTTCEEVLDRELGAEPSSATRELADRIRTSEDRPSDESPPTRDGARTEPPSIAVLPFEHLAADDERYFTDGLTEDLITALSRFGSLFVIARASSYATRDRQLTDQQIGEELGAQYLVRGSVRRGGRRLRLSVQLIDAATGVHVWAQRFDREVEDVFLVQDEVTETIVSTLAGRFEAAGMATARRLPEERLAAYDYVLRGKALHHRTTPEACNRAIEMFEQAIERDPGYAVAHAWLACAFGQAMSLGLDSRDALLAKAEAEVERALELDENESECHRILAQVNILRHDLPRAKAHQEKALFLNPNDDRSVNAMGTILTLSGEPLEGELLVRRAMRLNPYHPKSYWFHLGRALFHQERWDDALAAFRQVINPKLREFAYRAASAAFGNDEDPEATKQLAEGFPSFDPEEYADSVPYLRPEDRETLVRGLEADRTR